MYNQGNYGYNSNQSQLPTSSGQNHNSWKNLDSNRCESWRVPGRSDEQWRRPEHQDFQLGRDRAPAHIDEQFLIRIGAKRLNNGNLVDRQGFTLRQRDFECRAPSPPTFNPGRQERTKKWSNDELDKRIAEQKVALRKRERIQQKKQRNLENRRKREEEGADEYEEEEPEPKKAAAPPPTPPAPVNFQQRPLRAPKLTQQREWLNEYEKDVNKRKAVLFNAPPNSYYGNPMLPTSSTAPAHYNVALPNSTYNLEIRQKPPQMELPPPGIVEIKDLVKKEEKSKKTRNFYDGELFVPTETSDLNPFGIRVGAAEFQEESSSESEEDEAIRKLRDIIKNYGAK